MKNNRTAVTLTVIFFALLLLPQVICLFDRQQTDVASENRNLARFPRLKWSRFASEFEEYYNDRIPFRNRMLKYCRNIQCKLFAFTLGTAIAGKEDFCFYSPKNKKNAFLQHAGKIRYTAYEMKKIHKYLEKLNQYLHARNIDFLLVIPPDKIQVYPEHLPERRRYAESPYAPIPSLRKYLNEQSSKVPRLFLVDDLLQAKKNLRQ